MTRRIIVALLRFTLRIYFRRIEITGLENVPLYGPVIFVLNHPNALVDPVFLLCLAPRRVAFVAKAPLFRMPVLGFFVRALDSLPAYRRQDQGEDVTKNVETFVAARKLLAKEITIGICPEGVSHDEPGLRPIKTGAARIALGAVSTGEVRDLKVVPAGLYYTSKTTFRSSALLYYGKAIDVRPVELEADGNPTRAAVRELSGRIETALREVMLDAQHEEALNTVARAERIFSSGKAEDDEDSLTAQLQLRQRFVRGYTTLREQAPERLERLQARISRFEEELRQAGVDAENLSPPKSALRVIETLLVRCLMFLLLLGPASLGIVIHFPVYRLGGFLAIRLSKGTEQDVISTIKIISAMLFYPLTWLVLGFVVCEFAGWRWALAVLILLPITGYIAMRFLEELDAFIGGLRAVAFFLTRRRFFVRLLAERRAIKAEILALGEEAALATR